MAPVLYCHRARWTKRNLARRQHSTGAIFFIIISLFLEFSDNEKYSWNQSVYNSNRKDYGEVVVYYV